LFQQDFKDPQCGVLAKYDMIKSIVFSVVAGAALASNVKINMPQDAALQESSLLVDPGLMLDAAPRLLKAKVSEDEIKAINAANTKLLQEYQASLKDSGVTDDHRKATVHGMMQIFASKQSFHQDEINADLAKKHALDEKVIKLKSMNELLTKRNKAFMSIKDKMVRCQARAVYRHGLELYCDLAKGMAADRFGLLVNKKDMDWKQWEQRYMDLVKGLVDRSDRIGEVRGLLAKWLREGDAQEEKFKELNAGAKNEQKKGKKKDKKKDKKKKEEKKDGEKKEGMKEKMDKVFKKKDSGANGMKVGLSMLLALLVASMIAL